MPHPAAAHPSRSRRVTAQLLATLMIGAGLGAAGLISPPPSQAAPASLPTPAGLTAAIEAPQPYVGQSTCDPVAKPGVSAFRDLLLRTYPDSGSYGIVVDCGGGGQSEHKEGRAFDWKVSINNANHVAEVNAVLAWLTATDRYGNKFAMARRLGIMYMIWNRQMWRSYEDGSWRAYSGVSAHTDHVHFSFGWNGAHKVTSYWDASVAPIDYGPGSPPPPPPLIPPFRDVANIRVLREYAGLTLRQGSTGEAVVTVQRALGISADGAFGSGTAGTVSTFQQQQNLPVSGVWGPTEWRRLFLPPVNPFGQWTDARATPGATLLTGWAVDADTSAALSIGITVAGTTFAPRLANDSRPDVAASYPATGPAHGFSLELNIPDGTHPICLTLLNAPGTPGVATSLGCKTVVVTSGAFGVPAPPTQVLESLKVQGWALDTATAGPVQVRLSVDGRLATTVTANVPRPDVGATWKGFGDAHGYAALLPMNPGAHSVCATALRASGTGSTALGCKPFTMRSNGAGAFEALYQTPTGTYAKGWAFDPDSAASVNLVLSVDGQRVRQLMATTPRQDVAYANPVNGANHGWATTWNVPTGTHQICAYAANAAGTPGVEALIDCRTLTVRNSPVGQLAEVRTVPGGEVEVVGWQIDPDVAASGAVDIWAGGVRAATLVANGSRPDIGASHPGYGNAHGFSGRLRLSPGNHKVCGYGRNIAGTPGGSTEFGCLTVTVANPIGTFDTIKGGTGAIEARGWAIDPDLGGPIEVWGYVDGVPVRSGSANRLWPGLGWHRPGYGDRHGWILTMAAKPGTHQVCVTAINGNNTPGARSSLSCRSVWVR